MSPARPPGARLARAGQTAGKAARGGGGARKPPAEAPHPPGPCRGRGRVRGFDGIWLGCARDGLGCHGVDRLRVGGHGVSGRVWYQATVAAVASASEGPAAPHAAWYLLVSRTKGSPNW